MALTTLMNPPSQGLLTAINVVQVVSPAIVFLCVLSLFFTRPDSIASSSPTPIVSVVVASRIPRRALILSLLSLSAFTYLFDGLTYVLYDVLRKAVHPVEGEINAILGLAAYSGLAAVGSWKDILGVEVWFLKRVRYAVAAALALDIALVLMIASSIRNHRQDSWIIPLHYLLHLAFPTFRVLVLVPLYASILSPRVVYHPVQTEDYDETVPTTSSFLLPPDAVANPSSGLLTVPGLQDEQSKYGTFRPTRSTLQQSTPVSRATTPPPPKTDSKPEIALEPTWSEMWMRIKRISPYLWPSKSPSLQLLGLLCVIVLLIGRFINAAIPFVLGELIKIFEHNSDRSLWVVLGVYVTLRFLQGSGGLAALRDALWTPVMQYSDLEMSQLSFNHLLNLSFAFHTRRKTGEILRVLDRGAAINHTLELLLFNILPTFIDIAVALGVFIWFFEWTLALVIFIVMFAYVAASIILTRWRTRIRRQMNERDVITRGIHTDCLLNYETVKYFGGEEHEAARYRDAIAEYQTLEYRVIISLNLLNLIQNCIITLGLLIGSFIVARRVVAKGQGASEFVIFITYLSQLYSPLNQLGYFYRSVNQSLVDTEKLLKLLNEPTEVNDRPGAPDLIVENGEIEFDNVSFSYDGRTTALNGVSFKVPRNSSVALVGESGSGKSTILRLLYRFYDLGEGQGRILIDGEDIRDVTQKSLRQAIGVVPQDSVLFNTSIKYNIGYGKFGASEDDIEAAARSAQMHDRIMSFPQGYGTVVGERGVRLSGGEKQRVAIARTLLKNPPILLLDEATSALDTSTEKDIQKALQNLMTGRSSLSIAHRLSTIASADLILVLKDGQIIEEGSHKELLALNGIFASMWADQVSAEETTASEAAKDEISGYLVGPSEAPAESASQGLTVSADVPTEVAQDGQARSLPTPTPEPTSAIPVDATLSADKEEDKVIRVDDESAQGASQTVAFPSSEEPAPPVPTKDVPVLPVPSVPLAFPTSESEAAAMPTSPTPGVTFDTTSEHPSRTGTPDPESEPKRKRISSQNFQRLARRISVTTKRQGSISSMIPSFKRDISNKGSVDDGAGTVSGDAGGRRSTDSPSSSVHSEPLKIKKKDKKDKRKSTGPS